MDTSFRFFAAVIFAAIMMASGCASDSHTAKGARQGAASGAMAGGVAGSRKDKAIAAQRQAAQEPELEQLRKSIGTDAYNGIEALADCKHDVAIANARVARNSSNRDFALAGLWIDALTEADRNEHARTQALYPIIISQDRDIKTAADAEATMRKALNELGEIRVEYGQPAVCPS